MFSYFYLKMLTSPRAVTKCAIAADCPAFKGRLSSALHQLVVPAHHAENITNIGIKKILAFLLAAVRPSLDKILDRDDPNKYGRQQYKGNLQK